MMRLHSLSTWNAITKNSSVKKYFKNFSLMTKPIKNPDALLTQQNKIKVTFNSKCKVSNNCYVLRFLLPDTNKFLGIKTCQYIYLESKLPDSNQVIRRPYHPISLDTDKGFVDILIKVYPKCDNYGVFSNYLNSLDEGDVIELSGPYGNVEYEGNGTFVMRNEKNETMEKKVNKLGLIAGGTGITPMFQIIQKVQSAYLDRTALSIIYATKSLDEFPLLEDLVKLQTSGRLFLYPVIENASQYSNWEFGIGKVTEEMILDYMPLPSDKDSMICICGSREMIKNHLKPMLKNLNYKEENLLMFD